MKTIPISLLILWCSMLFANGATAQNKPLACQTDAMGGLVWENGQWLIKRLIPQVGKFILVQTGNDLTKDSVAKALGSSPLLINCKNANPEIMCTELAGNSLYFNPLTLKGGMSSLIGSTSSKAVRDSVDVQIFSCTAF